MAYKLNDVLNKAAGRMPVPCSDKCEYFRFPHLVRACELSDVYSVAQGVLCYEFKEHSVKTICCYCLKEQGIPPKREDSHGMCARHYAEEMAKLDEDINTKGGNEHGNKS